MEDYHHESYGTKDLKGQISGLDKVREFTLTPLLEVIFHRWIEQLPKGPAVTHVVRQDEGLFSTRESYICVVDGKAVNVTGNGVDIDVMDDDESWYAVGSVSFSGPKGPVAKLAGTFKDFSGSQGLDSLVRAAAKDLRKGKTYHLSDEMLEFYFK